MEFANEQEEQRWIAEQRAQGRDVKRVDRSTGQRFAAGAEISWHFGGPDAFREIGRIALNFLAHAWPEMTRHEDLRPFKDYIRGTRTLKHGEPLHVWYAPADSFALPAPHFTFGHQILLRVGGDQVYARVRFFGAFDLLVWFGSLRGVPAEIKLIDIDPLADHPPDDVLFTAPLPDAFPPMIVPPTKDVDVRELLIGRMRELLARVEDRQWAESTAGLLDEINATRPLPAAERTEKIIQILEPHLGRVLFLARHVAAEARKDARSAPQLFAAEQLERMTAHDPASRDGLTDLSRECLASGHRALADAIVKKLDENVLGDAALRLMLAGGPGAAVVGGVLTQRVVEAAEAAFK